jgi:L-rhamnose mutarotase
MTRHVLTVNLKNDPSAIAAYRDHHRHVWPEVLASLRKVGVEQLDIHLLGRRLVMIVEMNDGLDFRRAFAAHMSSNPRVAEWERLMKSLQERSPYAADDEWWAVMEPVFRLEDQEPAIAQAVDRSRTS